MRERLFGVVVLIAACSAPASAQDWSVVIGAIGADETATAHSGRLLAAVREELEPHRVVSVRDTVQDLRVDLPVAAVFGRAVNLGASGAAVLQFHATDSAATGFAHLWVSRPGGIPEERIEYVPDAAADLGGPARSFAATIISTLSRGAYALVEFHVFTWPRGVSFTVGGSDPVITDRPGREPGEGFNMWSGVQPAGLTEIRLSRPPDYADRLVTVEVPGGGASVLRVPIEVSLTRTAP